MKKLSLKKFDPKIANPPKCGGYRYPDQCPYNGKCSLENKECNECIDDQDQAVQDAIRESYRIIINPNNKVSK